jgi:DNA-binding GntR family transcriptional regulator
LPHHHDVLAAISKRQPEVARNAMMRLIVDARANIAGKRRGAKKR